MRTIRLKIINLANMLLKDLDCIYRYGNQFMYSIVGPSCIILYVTHDDLVNKAQWITLGPNMEVLWSVKQKHGYIPVIRLESIREFDNLSKAL